jgi:hypothetical protein
MKAASAPAYPHVQQRQKKPACALHTSVAGFGSGYRKNWMPRTIPYAATETHAPQASAMALLDRRSLVT